MENYICYKKCQIKLLWTEMVNDFFHYPYFSYINLVKIYIYTIGKNANFFHTV